MFSFQWYYYGHREVLSKLCIHIVHYRELTLIIVTRSVFFLLSLSISLSRSFSYVFFLLLYGPMVYSSAMQQFFLPIYFSYNINVYICLRGPILYFLLCNTVFHFLSPFLFLSFSYSLWPTLCYMLYGIVKHCANLCDIQERLK